MTTDLDNNTGLNTAFGDSGTRLNSINYGHPHGEKILHEICSVLRESKTGSILLAFIDKNVIPVHIMKGTGESGYSPELGAIYLQIPGKVEKATPQHVLEFTKALHEGGQEQAGFHAPDAKKDLVGYAAFIHARNLDSLTETLKIVSELTNSLHFDGLMKSLAKMSLDKMYEAYLNGATREQLYDAYTEAYEEQMRGK